MPQTELLTDEQFAAMLGIQPQTPRAWRCRGRGPAFIKVGRMVRYRSEDVRAWLSEHRSFRSTSEATVATEANNAR